MKKIILTLIFFLNIAFSLQKGDIHVSLISKVRAQQGNCGNWDDNSGGNFGAWVGGVLGSIGTAIGNAGTAVGNFFSSLANAIGSFLSGGNTTGGEGFGDEENGTVDLGPEWQPDEPLPYEHEPPPGMNEDEVDYLQDLWGYYNTYVANTTPPHTDTALAPTKDTACDEGAVARSHALTSMLDSIENKTDMINFRVNLKTRTTESGMSITNDAGTYNTFWYVTSGTANSVTTLTTYPTHTIVANIHAHPPSTPGHTHLTGPSPQDMYKLLQAHQANNSYNTEYVMSGDSPYHEFAITITDPVAADSFLAHHPQDSTINIATHDWKGSAADTASLLGKAFIAAKNFYKEGYSFSDANNFANLYMATIYNNMGIKIYRKVNGVFKEQNFFDDIDTNNKSHFKIKMCQ